MSNQGAQLLTPKYDTGTGKLIIGDGNDFQPIGIPPYEAGKTANMVVHDPATGGMSAGGNVLAIGKTRIQKIRELTTRTIVWWGDSTTEQTAGTGQIPYVAGPCSEFDVLPGVTLHTNYGANGYTTSAILSAASTQGNGGGNIITPEGVGAACVNANLLVLSFGINDFRQDTDIATYGSAAWVAKVLAFQDRVKTMISRVRAISPAPVLFMVPNTLCASGSLLVGVTGQAVTDAIRAAYIGDTYNNIPPLASLIVDAQTCDAGAVCFGVISPALAVKPATMADELHPSSTGYALRTRYVAEWLDSICQDDEYRNVCGGRVIASAASYFDLGTTGVISKLFGNTSSTSYGTVSSPGIGVGSTLLFTYSTGKQRAMRLTRAPDQNNGEAYMRWFNGGPDGVYHASDIPAGTPYTLRARKVGSVFEAKATRVGYKIYPVRVTAGSSGSITVRGLPGDFDLAARSPTTADFLALPSTGAASGTAMGLPLTSATIVAATGVGAYTITLTGTDFTSSVGQIGAIIVPT